MKILSISLCVFAIIFVESFKDYCHNACMDVGRECALHLKSKEECFTKNTGCDNQNFKASCINNKTISLDSSLKELFINEHNRLRNKVAGGGIPEFGYACRMATIDWDEDLAELATMLGHQCKADHDSCRRTDKFFSPGQNLYIDATNAFTRRLSLQEHIVIAITAWYDEYKSTKVSDIDDFPEDYERVSHFTSMMTESNTHLGCGIVSYDKYDEKYKKLLNFRLITCNYARSHMHRLPVYTRCDKSAEKCATGRNSRYRNLCSPAEYYNVNNYTCYDIWDWDWQKDYKPICPEHN